MSDSESPDDRRKSPRHALSMLVQFRFNTFEDFLADYTHDISSGGMFIRTEEPQEEGNMIYLQFSLKDGSRLIEGLGKVVRCNPPGVPGRVSGMGVEFINFDEESMALIDEICATREALARQKF